MNIFCHLLNLMQPVKLFFMLNTKGAILEKCADRSIFMQSQLTGTEPFKLQKEP